MKDETYNGWTNWDTWNVATILANDETLYNSTKFLTANIIHDWCNDNSELFEDTDLGEVNWVEVAE